MALLAVRVGRQLNSCRAAWHARRHNTQLQSLQSLQCIRVQVWHTHQARTHKCRQPSDASVHADRQYSWRHNAPSNQSPRTDLLQGMEMLLLALDQRRWHNHQLAPNQLSVLCTPCVQRSRPLTTHRLHLCLRCTTNTRKACDFELVCGRTLMGVWHPIEWPHIYTILPSTSNN